jgi:hypothetical protein
MERYRRRNPAGSFDVLGDELVGDMCIEDCAGVRLAGLRSGVVVMRYPELAGPVHPDNSVSRRGPSLAE